MDTLSSILEEVPEETAATIEVDITPFLKVANPDRRVILTWGAPSVNALYNRMGTIQDLQKQFPQWNINLTVEVATLAACHQAPATGDISVGEFYARLAGGKNERLWLFLEAERLSHFPHLSDINPETLKKILLAQSAQEAASKAQPTPETS